MRMTKEERIQQNYEKDMKKLHPYGIKTNADGKYMVYLDRTDGGTPKAYFADKTGARIRIFATTFYRWRDEGKAVKVSDEELPRRKKKKETD